MLRLSRDLATTHVPVILTALLLLAIGYLLGAIPSGYLAGHAGSKVASTCASAAPAAPAPPTCCATWARAQPWWCS